MNDFIIELVVANRCGVLNRITGVYANRKHNIDRLTVCKGDAPGLAVMQIASRGDDDAQRQLERQLRKLLEVKSVVLVDDFTLLHEGEEP